MDVQRQSLEGLCLMRVALQRSESAQLPRAFSSLGLSDEEAWGLLNELVKSARSQGAMNVLDEVDIRYRSVSSRGTHAFVCDPEAPIATNK